MFALWGTKFIQPVCIPSEAGKYIKKLESLMLVEFFRSKYRHTYTWRQDKMNCMGNFNVYLNYIIKTDISRPFQSDLSYEQYNRAFFPMYLLKFVWWKNIYISIKHKLCTFISWIHIRINSERNVFRMLVDLVYFIIVFKRN